MLARLRLTPSCPRAVWTSRYDNTSFLDSKAAFVQNVYPRMWSHQHVVPVTESFAPNRSSGGLCCAALPLGFCLYQVWLAIMPL